MVGWRDRNRDQKVGVPTHIAHLKAETPPVSLIQVSWHRTAVWSSMHAHTLGENHNLKFSCIRGLSPLFCVKKPGFWIHYGYPHVVHYSLLTHCVQTYDDSLPLLPGQLAGWLAIHAALFMHCLKMVSSRMQGMVIIVNTTVSIATSSWATWKRLGTSWYPQKGK